MKLHRRILLAALLTAAAPLLYAQATFPSKPVRILAGFGPGTGPDVVARILAQKLSETWNGAAVLVENKTAAGGLLAGSEVARAAPDGHTLLLGATAQLAIAPHVYKKLPYDPVNDFVAISQVVSSDFILLVNPEKVPARNVRDFAAFVKQQPKGYFMGTFGAGSPGHFGAYILGDAIQSKPESIHYRTTGDVVTGLVSGDVQGVFGSAGFAVPNVQGGKLVAIGSTGLLRSPALPDVPTMKEQGFPIEFTAWYAIVAPAKTPADVVAKLSADIRRAVQGEDAKQKLEAAGFQVTATSADELVQIMRRDIGTWGRAVKATGFQAD